MPCKAGIPGTATVCRGLMFSICRVPSENDVLVSHAEERRAAKSSVVKDRNKQRDCLFHLPAGFVHSNLRDSWKGGDDLM